MQLIKNILIIYFAMWGYVSAIAQDIHFSQFTEAPLHINPALTGLFHGDQRVMLNYKNQWASISEPYRTYALAFDARLMKKHQNGYIGAGLLIFRDKAGDTQMGISQALASVSGIIKLAEGQKLSAGIQGGYAQKGLGSTDLRWGEQYDGLSYNASLPSGEQQSFASFGYADLAGGVAYRFARDETDISANNNVTLTVGGSFAHFTQPDQTFHSGIDKLGLKYIGHMDMSVGLHHTNTAMRPAVFYAVQNKAQEIVGGCLFRYTLKEGSKMTGLIEETALSVGGYYRIGDAIIPALMLEYANFALGISYDVNASKLKAASNARGGFEISIRYINPNPFKQNSKTRI